MDVVRLRNGNVKLVADEGKRICSRSTHFDEELGEEVLDVEGEVIYLGRYDRQENYVEVERED